MEVIVNEAMKEIAHYYAGKIRASGVEPTKVNLDAAIRNNWDKIKKEISQCAANSALILGE